MSYVSWILREFLSSLDLKFFNCTGVSCQIMKTSSMHYVGSRLWSILMAHDLTVMGMYLLPGREASQDMMTGSGAVEQLQCHDAKHLLRYSSMI